MPTFNEIVRDFEANDGQAVHDVSHSYLEEFANLRQRNVVAYYSGWLEGSSSAQSSITDLDMNGFMACFHGLKKDENDNLLGLDLILHTPGGGVAATASIIDYMRSIFGHDITVFVPQLAMSGGTMIALAAQEIYMGKHSSLGPVDPHLNGTSVRLIITEHKKVLAEFNQAPTIGEKQAVELKHSSFLNQIRPGFILECHAQLDRAGTIVSSSLETGMFRERENAADLATQVLEDLMDVKPHDTHIPSHQCEELGLVIKHFEDCQKLQDAILSVHHSFILHLSKTGAAKLIRNHLGESFQVIKQ